ncbi:two-component system sensor histidine kinase NblS [cyanobacterium endosymbiont of Epithemia clementina EcSB]|uniref:two-component system sensor histidine kinase NblS n=1 Tax=cyanobacterium endosymbiont of Epithemia clementina EcSB TaxID=3034674 RepID=UPI002480E76F|nr:ATP-binding protein [cyanobacterium endosymbiont of Epithemia clementina EcSB]WGT68522.1 ATP-binding protein [cyanobacterium endosymbiont of Epithemia clementina EcSB]
MAGATLAVSLFMSGLTFWAVNSIQQEAQLNDTRFGRDLGLLLASNVAHLIAEDHLTDVARISSRFYQSTSSVRYIIYADRDGKIFFGIPYSAAEVQNSLTIERYIQLPKTDLTNASFPLVRQHLSPDGKVTDVFVPLKHDGNYLGILAIGINPNPTVVNSSNLTRDVTIAVFVAIWAMVILGAVFNALTITRPIKELLVGVKNIAAGNFKQRINLPFEGELGELICSFNEMAERLERYEEQNIEELTAEKAKLETLVSTIVDGAILLDSNLELLLVNPRARRMFGWEGKDVIGTNIFELLSPELTWQLTTPLQEMAQEDAHTNEDQNSPESLSETSESHQGGSPWEFRITLTQPTQRIIRVLLTQVFDQYRETLKGIAMTVQDITREVELNAAKSQFISNVSHELRTPLFNIKSFIETLSEFGKDLTENERREFLETANNETDRLTRLVNDVLDLSRLESSKIYHLDRVDINQVVEQILRTYQLNAKDKQLTLTQEIEPNLTPILGHYDLLLQVMTNLVGNSLKFTEAGGRIVIRAYQLVKSSYNSTYQPQVRIEIADTGIGIDTEDQEAIFDRFFRVENRVHTLEGTGLGLSIVKNIIEKHHSQIHLISEVGVGTTFWFDLVIYQESSISLEESQNTKESTSTSLGT